MKYLILLIAMLATVAEAKEPAHPCLSIKNVKVQKLHQAGSTPVVLTLTTRCYVDFDTQNNLPIVETQSTSGLQAKVDFTTHPVYDAEISIFLTLIASKDAALGNQKLHGMIHYKDIVSGSYSDETLEFDVPIKVLRPEPMDTFAYDHPVWEKILLPFAVIAAIPICLLMFITTGQGCGG